jgi:aminoglycoside phosphotransferase (APT) family kinase protein
MYVAQVDKEHEWLPILARQLPLPILEPVTIAKPGDEFPRPWSIYRWIGGETASAGDIGSVSEFARDLPGFLAALYSTDASGDRLRLLRLDDATWARGRGWALWKALIMLAEEKR